MVWTEDQDNFKNKLKKKQIWTIGDAQQIWTIGDSQANDISLKSCM